MAPVYQFDPHPAPEGDFIAGELGHLVVGNTGRLLDARRTPVTVTRVKPETAAFEVEIRAFEDTGARWELPFEDVGDFQFARGSSLAPDDVVAELKQAAGRFDQAGHIECDAGVRQATLRRLATERRRVREWLDAHDVSHDVDVPASIASREGDPTLFALLEDFLAGRGLAEMDRRFTETFVSNPRSGELVKGHAIVLAELGLCSYRGKIVRDPHLFDGAWAKGRRAEHLLARLAFTQQLWSRRGHTTLTLYRAAATDGPLLPPRPSSFVSATFSKDVAADHFAGGPTTQVAVIWRQAVPLERLLMTFLETEAMSRNFKEAEAVLLADLHNRAF